MKTATVQGIDVDDCWNQIGIWGNSECAQLEAHFHCRNCPVYAAAARRLLENRLPADYRREWTEHLARAQAAAPTETQPALILRLGDHWLGLAAGVIEEIIEMRFIHSVPHRGGGLLRGLVNFRGELVICLSLGSWLGIERGSRHRTGARAANPERLVVLRSPGGPLVFPASEVRGIRHYHPDALTAVPETLPAALRPYCRGGFEWSDRTVFALDEKALLAGVQKNLG